MDDVFTNLVFKYRPELFIKIIRIVFREVLGIENVEINPESIKIQEKLPNIHSKEVIIDIKGEDYENNLFAIEFQIETSKFPLERGIFIEGAMIASSLEKGQDYKELPNSSLIVFALGDITGNNLPIDSLRLYSDFTETAISENKSIYVNLNHPKLKEKYPEIYKLGLDLRESNPDKIIDNEIRDVIKYFKESEVGMQQGSPGYMEVLRKWEEEITERNEERFIKEIVPKLREEIMPKLREEIEPKLREEIEPKVREEIEPKLRKEIEAELRERFETEYGIKVTNDKK